MGNLPTSHQTGRRDTGDGYYGGDEGVRGGVGQGGKALKNGLAAYKDRILKITMDSLNYCLRQTNRQMVFQNNQR